MMLQSVVRLLCTSYVCLPRIDRLTFLPQPGFAKIYTLEFTFIMGYCLLCINSVFYYSCLCLFSIFIVIPNMPLYLCSLLVYLCLLFAAPKNALQNYKPTVHRTFPLSATVYKNWTFPVGQCSRIFANTFPFVFNNLVKHEGISFLLIFCISAVDFIHFIIPKRY